MRAANSISPNGTSYNYIKEGDTKNAFPLILLDYNGDPVDLTGATVTWDMFTNRGRVIADKAVELGSGTGEIILNLDENDQTGSGVMGVEVKVVYSDSKVEKFPAQGAYQITITKSSENVATTPVSYATLDYFNNKIAEIDNEVLSALTTDGTTWEV